MCDKNFQQDERKVKQATMKEQEEVINGESTEKNSGSEERETVTNSVSAGETGHEQQENKVVDEDLSTAEENEKSPEVLVLEQEKQVIIDRISRLQADFDNYRKRAVLEKQDTIRRANENLLTQMLPIIDNFERALEAVKDNENAENLTQGVEMIYRQILALLEKEGVVTYDALGDMFDPHLHHAVLKEPAAEDVAEDTIIAVLQKGYMYQERVLRPAMVKVAE